MDQDFLKNNTLIDHQSIKTPESLKNKQIFDVRSMCESMPGCILNGTLLYLYILGTDFVAHKCL